MRDRLLYTLGYEGAALSDFLATLSTHKIKQIIDVRDLPLSRKRGFSKNALAAALSEAGVKYLHVKSLGDPKPGRDAARSGDIPTFRRIYGAHLAGAAAQSGLVAVANAARNVTSSLLCYERDHLDCHRAIVADNLKAEFVIQHIAVTPLVEKRRRLANDHHARSLAFG